MGTTITGLPGYRTAKTWEPRKVRASPHGAQYLPGGKIINGSIAGDGTNTSYVDVLRPGKVMAKQSSGGKYRNAILGKSTLAYADNDTTITVGVATATEIARVKAAAGGGNLSLLFVGPPTAAGTVAETAVTCTGVDTANGTITTADLNLNKVTDSLIVAADLVAGTYCLVDDDDYVQLTDQNNNRIDQPFARPLIGGTIDPAQIIDWPADTSTQDWLKGKLSGNTGMSQFRFTDDA